MGTRNDANGDRRSLPPGSVSSRLSGRGGERTVRLRERWLAFLLGAAPRIDEYSLADDPPQPLPPPFADALRIELGPDMG